MAAEVWSASYFLHIRLVVRWFGRKITTNYATLALFDCIWVSFMQSVSQSVSRVYFALTRFITPSNATMMAAEVAACGREWTVVNKKTVFPTSCLIFRAWRALIPYFGTCSIELTKRRKKTPTCIIPWQTTFPFSI